MSSLNLKQGYPRFESWPAYQGLFDHDGLKAFVRPRLSPVSEAYLYEFHQ